LGLSFAGTIGDAISIDKKLRPVSKRFMLYSDVRSISQSRKIAERIGSQRIYEVSGNPPSPASCVPKWLWLKDNRNRAFRSTWKFIQPNDFLVLKSTGRVCTDYVSASATMAFDIRKREWSEEILSAAGIDVERMPKPVESTALVGELTRSAARQMGLRSGLPVFTGAGDTGAMLLGAGAVEDGDAVLYLGGGAEVDLVTDKRLLDPEMRVPLRSHIVPGKYFTSVTALASGLARNWLAGLFGRTGKSATDSFTNVARNSGIGANGLLFLPYLLGEQAAIWDSEAKGVFVGLKASSTYRDLSRAVLESTAYSLSQILSVYKEVGFKPENFVVCGGGGRNSLLRQIVTDTLGVPTRLHGSPSEVAAIGAAICVAVGLHHYRSLHDASKAMVRYSERLLPNFDNHVKYIKMLRLSEATYSALIDIMHALSEFEQNSS
jgi:xylulokinase